MLSLSRRQRGGPTAGCIRSRPLGKSSEEREAQFKGGQFRVINELLYTSSSEDAALRIKQEKHLDFAAKVNQS